MKLPVDVAAVREAAATLAGEILRTPLVHSPALSKMFGFDVHEGELDEVQFVDWVKQASNLPGERM